MTVYLENVFCGKKVQNDEGLLGYLLRYALQNASEHRVERPVVPVRPII